MEKPFPSYSGTDPYIFVCYAHRDAKKVYADLVALNELGIRLWYDEGIPAGTFWHAEIAGAIQGADKLLFYISSSSLLSAHCLREVHYASDHNIEIVPVYLDTARLPPELDLVLSRVQALYRSRNSRYLEQLSDGLQRRSSHPIIAAPTRRGRVGIGLSLVLIAALSVTGLYIAQRDQSSPGDTVEFNLGEVAPNAYDRYLEGQNLLARWDKEENLTAAISLFRQAASLDADFALAYARLGEALRLHSALTADAALRDEAIAAVNEALRLNPNLAPVQVAQGRLQNTLGNYDLAFSALERALAIDPNDAEANQAMAAIQERQGRLEEAEVSFQKAVALEPENLLVRNAYANFLFRQNRLDAAAEQWQTVVRLAPDHYPALVNLGAALHESGRTNEAIAMYSQAIDIRPTYMAYANLGTASGHARRYDEAVTAYQQAIALNDSDWLAWGNLAYIYSWMGGRELESEEAFLTAIDLAERARSQAPRDPLIQSDLALYYAKLGQAASARERIQTALALAPDSGEILAAAAEVYELSGDREQAVDLTLRALDLGYPRLRLQRNPEFETLLEDPRLAQSI